RSKRDWSSDVCSSDLTHLMFELVVPVRTCVPIPLDRPTQVLRGSSRTIHLTHSEPTHTVRVCCLVLGPHSSQRVHHTRTHTHRVDRKSAVEVESVRFD